MILQRLLSSRRQPLRRGYAWELLRSLVDRDLKLMYKRSILGIAWTLINPLLQLAVFVLVFQGILQVSIPQYASYVFCGLLVWTWFQSSLFQATGVIISSRALIRQPGFPVAILPVVVVSTGLIHFALALPVLLLFILADGVQLTSLILILPLLIITQFCLTVSIAYFLAALNVTFRDTQHTLGVVLQLWFYLTPVFYSITSIPEEYWYLYGLNPMVHIVTWYRQVLIWGVRPDWMSLIIIGSFNAIALPIGYSVFKRQSRRFIEEI